MKYHIELMTKLQNASDLLEIRDARVEILQEPNIKLEEIEKEFGIN